MISWLRIDNIAFTVLEYPMSWIELVGTVLYLWSVWLIARRKMLTWPVGIVSVLLYLALFYQIGLYSDALEQVYYLGASVYGWVFWVRSDRLGGKAEQLQSGLLGGKVEHTHNGLSVVNAKQTQNGLLDGEAKRSQRARAGNRERGHRKDAGIVFGSRREILLWSGVIAATRDGEK